jgi:hypothetical protein
MKLPRIVTTMVLTAVRMQFAVRRERGCHPCYRTRHFGLRRKVSSTPLLELFAEHRPGVDDTEIAQQGTRSGGVSIRKPATVREGDVAWGPVGPEQVDKLHRNRRRFSSNQRAERLSHHLTVKSCTLSVAAGGVDRKPKRFRGRRQSQTISDRLGELQRG